MILLLNFKQQIIFGLKELQQRGHLLMKQSRTEENGKAVKRQVILSKSVEQNKGKVDAGMN